jgi:hypothetical protein
MRGNSTKDDVSQRHQSVGFGVPDGRRGAYDSKYSFAGPSVREPWPAGSARRRSVNALGAIAKNTVLQLHGMLHDKPSAYAHAEIRITHAMSLVRARDSMPLLEGRQVTEKQTIAATVRTWQLQQNQHEKQHVQQEQKTMYNKNDKQQPNSNNDNTDNA